MAIEEIWSYPSQERTPQKLHHENDNNDIRQLAEEPIRGINHQQGNYLTIDQDEGKPPEATHLRLFHRGNLNSRQRDGIYALSIHGLQLPG